MPATPHESRHSGVRALTRVLGAREALVHLERVEREQRGVVLGYRATTRQAKKGREALS